MLTKYLKQSSYLFFAISLLLYPLCAESLSQPTISNVTGNFSDGYQISISGSGFGSKGPSIQIFDNFENGTDGTPINLQATTGTWTGNGYAGRGLPIADRQDALSGSLSARMTNGDSWSSWRQVHKKFSATTEVFVSYWVRVPDGTDWPYATTPKTFPDRSSWKYTWLTQGDNTGENDLCLPSYNGLNSHSMGGNDYSLRTYLGVSWVNWSGWMRYSGWIKANPTDPTANGTIFYQVLNGSSQTSNTQTDKPVFDTDVTTKANKNWTAMRFPGNFELSAGGNYQILYDDIYLATGPNAAARIEIGNAPTYSACTELNLATVNQWSDSSINATFRNGSFSAGSQAYLYVIDANGNASTGFPITLGTTGSGTVPPPVDTAPSIVISAPSSTGSFTTLDTQISIAGSATDDQAISSISWSANLGGSGLADNLSGDWTTWGINSLGIAEGVNIITITATDTVGQTASQVIRITQNSTVPGPEPTPPGVKSWNANTQTGDPVWKNSSVTYTVRVLVNGDSITQGGSQVSLGFQGRSAGSYTIRKVSISERDINAPTGNVVDSTWTRVTFNGSSSATWGTDVITVPAGQSTFSDPVDFPFHAGKDYYVTFKIDTPSVYLNPPTGYQELYFQNVDRTDDVDWAGNGHSVTQDYHALQSIFVDGPVPVRLSPPTGLHIATSY